MTRETIAEHYMKYFKLEPLKDWAAVRVAITVCESKDMQNMIYGFRNFNVHGGVVAFSDDQLDLLYAELRKKLKQINVSVRIIDIVWAKLWPICMEISKWIIYHFQDTGMSCSPSFFWTPQNSIDYEKTAEALVKNEALDIKKRYTLACIYCMESEVRSLWEQMNLPERRSFFIRGNLKRFKKNQIVRYWTYYIQEVPIDYWGCKVLGNSSLFKYAVENGYLAATKFFLGKIRENMKTRMLSYCFTTYLRKLYQPEFIVKDHLAIACFLFNHYASGIRLVLQYFLEWPMQRNFLSFSNWLRPQIKNIDFGYALEAIFEKDMNGFKDYGYKRLFRLFWGRATGEYKTYVSTGSRFGYRIFMKFVKTHFGFIFEENAVDVQAKFRAMVFNQEIAENETLFKKVNVEFFKFLVENRVIIKRSIERFSQPRRHDDDYYIYFSVWDRITVTEFFNLPLGELLFLVDGILERV